MRISDGSSDVCSAGLADDPVGIATRLSRLEAVGRRSEVVAFPARKPFFCPGCPHNSSTRTPEGSISGGGSGGHVLALSVPKLQHTTFSQMGGEGLPRRLEERRPGKKRASACRWRGA